MPYITEKRGKALFRRCEPIHPGDVDKDHTYIFFRYDHHKYSSRYQIHLLPGTNGLMEFYSTLEYPTEDFFVVRAI